MSLFTLPRALFTAGSKLFFYQTGSSTPQNTYQDIDLTTAHANPVVADSAGYFAPIYLDPSLPDYRVTLTDSAGTIQTGYPVDDVPAASAGLNAEFARKASSTTKTSTTTLASDTELQLVLPTAGKYEVEVFLWLEKAAGTGAGGFKFTFNYTGTVASVILGGFANVNSTISAVGPSDLYVSNASFATLGASDLVRLSGIADVSTAGTFSLQWAQNTSSAQPTVLRINSYIKAERVL